jgi:hypothetical protein
MYPLVRELAVDGIPVTVTCRVLKIARQPYYRWLAAPVTDAELEQAYLANALFDAHRDDPEFGYRFLADEARDAGQRGSPPRRRRRLHPAHRPRLSGRSQGVGATLSSFVFVEEVVVGHGDYERLTPEAIDQVWCRMRAGQAAKPTARELGLCTGTARAYLIRCGGIRPEPRRQAAGRLVLVDREEIPRGLAAGQSIRAIALALGRAPSTISREVNANGGRRRYRAARADAAAWSRATRPKQCELAGNPVLRAIVEDKLARRWSPQQIDGWLKLTSKQRGYRQQVTEVDRLGDPRWVPGMVVHLQHLGEDRRTFGGIADRRAVAGRSARTPCSRWTVKSGWADRLAAQPCRPGGPLRYHRPSRWRNQISMRRGSPLRAPVAVMSMVWRRPLASRGS